MKTTYALCTPDDFKHLPDRYRAIDVEALTDEQMLEVLRQLWTFATEWLDERRADQFYPLSNRAQNVMKRNQCETIGQLRRLLAMAVGGRVEGAGRMVIEEWRRVLRSCREHNASND